ncbi:MAG: hypothetical protein ACRD6X_13105 [Pyrinomonadaceae bacterium]
MPLNSGLLSWDIVGIADALKITVEDVKEYFTDGRRISFILERQLAKEVLMGRLAPSEGASYDIEDSNGGKWEVRSISRGGVYFSPSYMVGSGRNFKLDGLISKLESIKGYVVSDIENFPNVPFWIIPSETVLLWWNEGSLGVIPRYRVSKLCGCSRRFTLKFLFNPDYAIEFLFVFLLLCVLGDFA